ncbi:MAG: SpoIIE family protein phosphatase [Acidobacteria bacterium]|nr:SpoIIE family protein phosphatase [Acidobacteriota bacterium]
MLRFSRSPVAVFLAGLVIFIVGLVLAIAALPEWRLEALPPGEMFLRKANQVAHRLNLRKLDSFQIHLTDKALSSDSTRSEREQLEIYIGDDAAAWLEAQSRSFYVIADTQVENSEGRQLSLDLKFSLDGQLVSVSTMPDEIGIGMLQGSATPGLEQDQIVSVLVREGEALGESEMVGFFGSDVAVYPVVNHKGEFVESIQLVSASNVPMLVASRVPATVAQIAEKSRGFSIRGLLRVVWRLATRVGFVLGIIALLAVLVTRRSIGLKNSLLMAGIQFLLVIPPVIRGQQQLFATIALDLAFLGSVFFVFLSWSAAESWYRILSSEATTGLDHLRERMLGHGEGRSLMAGWGMGAAVAGFLLICSVIAHHVRWLTPTALSVDLSAVYEVRNPWFSGAMVTIAILLSYCVAMRWFRTEWRTTVMIVLGTLLLIPKVQIAPSPVAVLIALGAAALLVWTLRTYQLLGLLTAALILFSAPVAAFSILHPAWQPVELLLTGAIVVAPLVMGIAGLRRVDSGGRERVTTPIFMRRLEHERRLRYEMDLLARMQLGLLPVSPPDLPKWDIAVRSVLPTEVGGDFYEFIEDEEKCLWIAMGDVSGHGYQCSIVHAMTKAALLSLVSAKLRPAEIMNRLDQVLRHSGTARTFVALALMRIDPGTGEIDFSNAASPFPIIVEEQGVHEIELSTLPLGHGPVQVYRDHNFVLGRGSAMIFWSDGLYEARNTRDDEYGYDRPGEIAQQHRGKDATAIMEAVFADWTEFRGGADLEDDTTVLVIKREQ